MYVPMRRRNSKAKNGSELSANGSEGFISGHMMIIIITIVNAGIKLSTTTGNGFDATPYDPNDLF